MLAINFLLLTYVVSTVSGGATKFLINRLCTSKTKKYDIRTVTIFFIVLETSLVTSFLKSSGLM